MYQFKTEENRKLFLEAMDNAAPQHLFGTITLADGTTAELNCKNILGSPSIENQILEDSEVFGLGELYIGELELTAVLELGEKELKGAEIKLFVTVDGCPEGIPMGVWNIQSAERTVGNIRSITAYDRIAGLSASIPQVEGAGLIGYRAIYEMLSKYSGIPFAQSYDELAELVPEYELNWGGRYTTGKPLTCWLGVCYFAQLLGCYAFANRYGEIEFRRFTEKPVNAEPISAVMRHNARLSDYSYKVGWISYTNKDGQTYTVGVEGAAEDEARLKIPTDNALIANVDIKTADPYMEMCMRPIAIVLGNVSWYPGNIEIFGNPALDVGDMIQLTGGVSGEKSDKFLICHSCWQFNGPQTLVSGGMSRRTGEASGSGSGGGSGSSGGGGVNVVTKTITTLSAETTQGRSTAYPTEFAGCSFSVSAETVIFVSLNANVTAFSDCTAELRVLLDGIMQTVHSSDSMRGGERKTVSLTFPLTVSGGGHTVTAEAVGDMEIERITCDITGQELKETKTDDTFPTDFKYHVEEGGAVIDYYTVRSLTPRIPACLDGNPVRVLGGQSFTETPVTYVYIPDGTEAIK